MKSRTHNSTSTVKAKRGFIDAFVVQPHDFSSYVNIRNLIIFLLDRITHSIDKESMSVYIPEIIKCVDHLRSFHADNTLASEHDLQRLITDIIDECEILIKLTQSFLSTQDDFEIQTLITARSTQIHWLCVCALEDLKKTLPIVH